MTIRHLLSIAFLACWFLPSVCFAQSDLPIREWKSILSIKRDEGFLKQAEVGKALNDLDIARRCEALHLLNQAASKGNTRFQIRTAIILVSQTWDLPNCKDTVSPIDRLEQALRQCYEIEDNLLAIHVHRVLANVYNSNDKLGLAIVHWLAAKDGMEKEGLEHFQDFAMMLYNAADMLYRSCDNRYAANLYNRALRYHGEAEFNKMDSLSTNWRMNSWNNLGLCYKRLMLYDSAMYAFEQALHYTTEPFWLGLLSGNRGDVFYLQGRYDSAEPLLKLDYQRSFPEGEINNAAITMERLANITNITGNPAKALKMMRTADSLENIAPAGDVRASILHSYAAIFRDLGMADSAYTYMEKYKFLADSLNKHTTDNRIEIAELQLSNQENINQIYSLQKEKNRIKLIRNFSIALILALAAFGYGYLNRLRLQSRLKQQEATEAKRKAELEMALAKEQLNNFTENLREKTQQIEELQLRSLEKEHHREQIEQMQELTTYTILTDADWERFKNLFIKVYPGFFIDLKEHVPDITLAEQRMAALIKLHVPNKEAAAMLGISHNSIYKTRQRLRQRLGFEKDEEMDEYFKKK